MEALPVLVDRHVATKLVEDDERLAAIVIEFVTAVPSPPGRRLAYADLLTVGVTLRLGRGNQPKLSATAVCTIRVCRCRPGKTAQYDCASGCP